ncbi:MAG: pyridoxamine 5'-phosphate oxidase family protein [Sulfitobacter sp.]
MLDSAQQEVQSEFWDSMEDIRAGMLSAGSARAVPMTHYLDKDQNTLWFITAKGTELAIAAQDGAPAQYTVTSKDEGFYARIDGALQTVTDPAKLDEIWNRFAAAWFEDGKQDPDVQLLRMPLSSAETWETGGSLSFLYEIAKANMSDSKPDAGRHSKLRF